VSTDGGRCDALPTGRPAICPKRCKPSGAVSTTCE
jgi:hypothetical protein